MNNGDPSKTMARDWEDHYRRGEIPWDKGQAAPPLEELWDRYGSVLWLGGPVLMPGCGLGHDVRALAAEGLEVVGLDVSATAVAMASAIPAVGCESYEHGDFLDPAWREGRSFVALWEHTCFCAIHPDRRGDYAAAAAAVLPAGGFLAGVFYLTPHDPGEDEDGPPFGTTVAEIDAWFAPWFERIDAWVPSRAYPGREGREWLAIFRKLAAPRVAG